MNVLKSIKCLVPILVLGLYPIPWLNAQTFATLHSFTNGPDNNVEDAGLILSGNTLYGTTSKGGGSSNGSVFAINIDGTGFTNLYDFSPEVTNAAGSFTNSDGANPSAGLILSGNTLYGTATFGGSSGAGTLFAVNTDGTDFTNLHNFTAGNVSGGTGTFTNGDGLHPGTRLILSGSRLYGSVLGGGSSGWGTVFAINTDGTDFTNLYNFSALSRRTFTNSDGAGPEALTLSSNTLYGTAQMGGTWGHGTMFAINIDGTDFTNLYNFSLGNFDIAVGAITNSDGINPRTDLILSDNVLYETASFGGISGVGTVFAINTDGSDFMTLHSFAGGSDGANPNSGLVLSGNTLYGTTEFGGISNAGTIFAINTDGTGFTNLYSFSAGTANSQGTYTNSDGSNPESGLIVLGNTLYGKTQAGGIWGGGTVFNISLPLPQLTITPSGANIILAWPTNVDGFDYSGFILQSTTNLVSSVGWGTNFPAPAIVNGQYAVTNPISGSQMFYRLSK